MVTLTSYRLQIALDVLAQLEYEKLPYGYDEHEYIDSIQKARRLVMNKLTLIESSEGDE